MCVNHRRADILMTQEFLDRADIRSRLEQVSGKTVPQRMTANILHDTRRLLRASLNARCRAEG
jgi:hypothetical protein